MTYKPTNIVRHRSTFIADLGPMSIDWPMHGTVVEVDEDQGLLVRWCNATVDSWIDTAAVEPYNDP